MRDFGDTARIEIWPEQMDIIVKNRDEIVDELKKEGYEKILLDLEGYRTGSISNEKYMGNT